MNTATYPEGWDYFWLASDREGHIGAFTNAGLGPIPLVALPTVQTEDIEVQLRKLPRVSQAQVVFPDPGDDWIEMAERGVFAYDWHDLHRKQSEDRRMYDLFAVPTKPITIDSLPADLAAIAGLVRLENVVFGASTNLDIRAHVPCLSAQIFRQPLGHDLPPAAPARATAARRAFELLRSVYRSI